MSDSDGMSDGGESSSARRSTVPLPSSPGDRSPSPGRTPSPSSRDYHRPYRVSGTSSLDSYRSYSSLTPQQAKDKRKADNYATAMSKGRGLPEKLSSRGGVRSGDEGWNVEEDGQPERKMIDLVFILDATGSMGSYLKSATQNIENICETILNSEKLTSQEDLRVAVVAYKDYPPQDYSYVTETLQFTSDIPRMHAFLAKLYASGGGDGPEAVITGMAASLTDLTWRRNAAKMVVIVTDAAPHGIGENGDGFEDGEPGGWDGIVLARNMAARGISCFVVACEPNLAHYKNAIEYYHAIAQITSGMVLPLMTAELLTNAIIGSVLENMEMDTLIKKVGGDIMNVLNGATDEASIDRVAMELQNALSMQGYQSKTIHVANIYNQPPEFIHNVNVWKNAEDSADALRSLILYKADRYTPEYDQYKRDTGADSARRHGFDFAAKKPKSASSGLRKTLSPSKAVGKDGKIAATPAGLFADDDDDDMAPVPKKMAIDDDSDSDTEQIKSPYSDVSRDLSVAKTFAAYKGGEKRLSGSGPTTMMGGLKDFKGEKFSGMRGSKVKVRNDSDDEDDVDSTLNKPVEDDDEVKPNTLAFGTDAISLDQAKRVAMQSIWRMRK